MAARQEAAGGDDQKPLSQLSDFPHDRFHLARAIVNADAAIVNKVFHSDLLNKFVFVHPCGFIVNQ